jgi:hypothetical protein
MSDYYVTLRAKPKRPFDRLRMYPGAVERSKGCWRKGSGVISPIVVSSFSINLAFQPRIEGFFGFASE